MAKKEQNTQIQIQVLDIQEANSGHECLRVTDPSLTPEKFAEKNHDIFCQKVYKLIWQRTIASAFPNAQISETKYLIDNNGEKFILVSNEIVEPGYKKIYSYSDDDDKTDGPVKETFATGEILKETSLDNLERSTKPKPRFSESTLVKELKKNEIGRPSTTATIVETVLSPSRGYAELQDKSIVPTERGMRLAEFLDRSFSNIINLNYTKEMEKSLDKIASGKMSKLEFLQNFYKDLEETISKNLEGQTNLANSEQKICPECGATLVLRRSKYGKMFWGCSKFPACRHIENI